MYSNVNHWKINRWRSNLERRIRNIKEKVVRSLLKDVGGTRKLVVDVILRY